MTILPNSCTILQRFYVARQSPSSARGSYQPTTAPRHTRNPPHIAYIFLFRRTASFRKAAAEAGKPKAVDPVLRGEANLTARQSEAVDEISAATLQEVDQQDARARTIIQVHFDSIKADNEVDITLEIKKY